MPAPDEETKVEVVVEETAMAELPRGGATGQPEGLGGAIARAGFMEGAGEEEAELDGEGVGASPRISAIASELEEVARRLARRCLERALRE